MPPKAVLGGVLIALALTACGSGDEPPTPSAAPSGPSSAVARPSTTDTAVTTSAAPATDTPATTPAATTSAPPPKPTASDQPEIDQAVCAVQGPALRALYDGATGDNRYEALRDAIPELQLRIAAIDPTTRPKLRTLVASLQSARANWVTALQSYDDGIRPAATRALAAADRSLAEAAALARAAIPAGGTC